MSRASRGYFADQQGVKLPSVTTILNATKPQEDREALAQWRQRVGTAEASQIAIAASRRGTLTHKQIRHYLSGQPLPCPELVYPYWASIQPILANVQEVRLLESVVFHYDLGYAGKVDCVASYQGVPCVFDWKTADRPKGSVERLYDAPLQLAAYCGAVNHSHDFGDRIDHALLVVAIPEHPAEVFWFEADTLQAYWHQWQARVEQFYHQRRYHR